MHFRLPLWLALSAFVALGAIRAQTPTTPAAAAPAAMPPGQIVAKQVTGTVTMMLNGATTALHDNDAVSQSATIITQNQSSVILVFSNGATTQLGADTTLSIDQFLQDPFTSDINVGALTTEPTHSKTKLHLTKGELLGKVAHLKINEGSSFTVETPVGAAGIRGTTFRIVFRPSGTGQAFAVFSLSTVEGNVNFQQGTPNQPAANQPAAAQGQQGQPAQTQQGQGNEQAGTQGQGNAQPATPSQGTTQAGTQTPSQGTATTPAATPSAPASGVAVTGGQEVVVTVSVNVNSQTGQIAVTAPPAITSTRPISVQTEAALVQQAQVLATTAATATFTAPPAAPATSAGTTSTTSSTQSDSKSDQKQGDKSSGDSSGGNSSSTSSSSTSSTASTGTSSTSTNTNSSNTSNQSNTSTQSNQANQSATTNQPAATNTGPSTTPASNLAQPPANTGFNSGSPAVTSTAPALTPGAGLPGH